MADRIDISAVARVVDQASRPLRAITGGITNAGTAATRTSGAFFRLNAIKFGGLTAGIRGVGSSLGNLLGHVRGLLGPLVAMAGVASFGGAVAGMKSFISTTDQLAKKARQLGLSAEDLQKFRFVAQQSGVEAGTMEGALGKLVKTLGTVSKGGKEAAKLAPLFSKMGITIKEIRAGDLAAILPKVAAGFAKNTNVVERARVATALFGKSGSALINMFAQGRVSMEEMMAEAVRLGIITNDQAKEAENAQDAWGEFTRAIEGVKNAIAGELLPAVAPMLRYWKELIVANREVIKVELANFFKRVGEILKNINWSAIGNGIAGVARALDWMARAIGGWEYLILAFVALLNRKLIVALAQVGIAFAKFAVTLVAHAASMLGLPAIFTAIGAAVKAFSLALLASPITWFIAAIAALGLAAYLIIKHWEPIKQFFADLWNDPKATFWSALNWLGDFIGEFIPQPIKDAWAAFADFFAPLWDRVKAGFWTALGWLGDFVSEFIPQPIKDAWAALDFGGIWQGIRRTFGDVLSWYGELIGQLVGGEWLGAWRSVIEGYGAVWGVVRDVYGTALGWLGEFIGQFIPQPIKDAWAGLTGWAGALWTDVKTEFWAAVTWLGDFAGQFIPQPIKDSWGALPKTFDDIWQRVVAIFEWGRDLIGKAVQAIIAFIDPLLAPLKAVIGGIGWVAGKVAGGIGAAVGAVTGGGPAGGTAPATAAQPGLLEQNRQAQTPARVDGEIQQTLKIEASPELRASLKSERVRGPISTDVEVGRSMVPA